MSKCHKFDGNCEKIKHLQKNCQSKKKGKEKEKEKKGAEQAKVGEEYITFQADKEQYNFDTFNAYNADVNDN